MAVQQSTVTSLEIRERNHKIEDKSAVALNIKSTEKDESKEKLRNINCYL